MAARNSISSLDADTNPRKRVCKACDRCRLKKSKCDGESPCGRCQADDAICVFGERRKTHDKVYPKGYVEMLEQQQGQIVNGLRELYERLVNTQGWTGPPLKTCSNGYPLTHDILESVGALKVDDASDCTMFEDDLDSLKRIAFAKDEESKAELDEFHRRQSSRSVSLSNNSCPDTYPSVMYSRRQSIPMDNTCLPTPPDQSPPLVFGPTPNDGMEHFIPSTLQGGSQSPVPVWMQSNPYVDMGMFGYPLSYDNLDLTPRRNVCMQMTTPEDEYLSSIIT